MYSRPKMSGGQINRQNKKNEVYTLQVPVGSATLFIVLFFFLKRKEKCMALTVTVKCSWNKVGGGPLVFTNLHH